MEELDGRHLESEMRHGKKQTLLSTGEQKELFSLVCQVQQGAETHEIWYALFDANGSARDRAAGYLAALAFGASVIPDAGSRRKARALLAGWYAARSKEAEPGGAGSDSGRVDSTSNGGAGTD